MPEAPLITPERVVEAYKTTSLKPIAGLWTFNADNHQCACGLTAIMIKDNLAQFEEMEDDELDRVDFVADQLKLPTFYVAGFINGFDGSLENGPPYVEDQVNFDKGYEDGGKAWDALSQAGIISVDQAEDLRMANVSSLEEV